MLAVLRLLSRPMGRLRLRRALTGFPQAEFDPSQFERLSFRRFFLQPMDGPNRILNTELAVRYCLEHPLWRLSLQTHKFLGIP